MNTEIIKTKKEAIKTLEKEISQKKDELENIYNEVAILSCPHKIGDIVIINGYSYSGKKMIIDRIIFSEDSWRGDWIVKGRLIKSDGKISDKIRVESWEEVKL